MSFGQSCRSMTKLGQRDSFNIQDTMEQSFIKTGEVQNICNRLGVNNKFMKIGSAAIESQKYICIKDQDASGNGQLTIIQPEKGFAVNRKANKSDGAIMHWRDNIIAIKAAEGSGQILQVFNFDQKKKLKHCELPDQITYWRWISLNKLAVVTSSAVYYIDISKESQNQVRVSDRGGLQNDQIIGAAGSSDGGWLAVCGISLSSDGKSVNGHIALNKIPGGKQVLQGYACCFGQAYIYNDTHKSELFCYCQKKSTDASPKIQMMEVSATPEGYTKFKKSMQLALENPADFPIYMQVSQKFGLLFAVTKNALVLVVQITSAQLIYRTKMANEAIFVCCKNFRTDGMLALSRSGSLHALAIDQSQYIPYILNRCTFIPNNQQLAVQIAQRYRMPGLEGMFTQQFNRFIVGGDYASAAKIAASAPETLFRNSQTLNKFKSLPQVPGQPPPIMLYFKAMLQKGKLNKLQSVELATILISQGKGDTIKNIFEQGKFEYSQELGDVVAKLEKEFSLKIYKQVKAHTKIVSVLNQMGKYQTANAYASQVGVAFDYMSSLRGIITTSPQGALNYAKNICSKNSGVNVYQIAQLFASFNRLQEMTAFLVECMKDNKPQDGIWQTKALQVNIMAAPQVAEAIFQMGKWTQFNRNKIAVLCQQKGMYQRSLQNYSELKDIKRVLNNAHMIPQKFLTDYFGKMSPQVACPLLVDIIKYNRQNTKLVVMICVSHNSTFGLHNCIKIFENALAYDGMFYYLSSIQLGSDKQANYKYIEAAAKCNQLKVVEEIIKNKSTAYDVSKVKDLLIDLKLADPKPLICLCDIHGLVEDLVKYLYKNNFLKFIQIYMFKVNNMAAPAVFGTLIDLEAEQSYIKQLLFNIRSMCPMDKLIEEFAKRNRLRVLQNWLDQRVQEGVQLTEVHNALAMVKIDTNQQPQEFLTNNQFYDPKMIGKFCQERDPHLAVTAYRRGWGKCDKQLIAITNKNSLFRIQAKYLVQRQSDELWREVLSPDNIHKKAVVEQVVSTALPDSKQIDQISNTVKAFLAADLQLELMALLEKIVLHHKQFSNTKKLQNLLIMTAMKSDKSRVMDYIKKLNNYDGPELANIALRPEYRLNQQAFTIFQKLKMHLQAVDVLLNNIQNLNRADQYAHSVNQNEVWSKLAHSYLHNEQVVQAIDCYLKAKDPSHYLQVINYSEKQKEYDALLKFLPLARDVTKDQHIDNAYCFALAKLGKLQDLENFIQASNSCDAQRVGDRCFNEQLYEAAKLFYISIKNNAKIASCLVFLGEYGSAIQAAKKANTPKTWRDLCIACVAAKQFKLAATAGLHIIIHPDHLEQLINFYETNKVPEEMISLLQTGLGLQRVHVGIFTELGILYAKYKPQRLIGHCKAHLQSMNVPKLLRICQKYQLWNQSVYLNSNYNEPDRAAIIMMEHSTSCFEHDLFAQLMQKVSNTDLHYKGMIFYLQEQPMMLNDLLKALSKKIDLTKCVATIKKTGYLPLITPFLKTVQSANSRDVNQALNELLLQEMDFKGLRQSISRYDNFDSNSLARATQKHDLLQFRRIAALLYRKSGKFDQSIRISKDDKMFRDAIETARDSQRTSTVQQLLKFFVQAGQKQFFSVCLYTCFQFIKPDLVLQYAWKYGLMDFAMPYLIQITRDMYTKIDTVQKKHQDREKKEEQAAKQQMTQPIQVGFMGMTPMLMNTPSASGMGMDMSGFSTAGLGSGMGTGMGMGMGNMGNSSGFGGFSSQWN